MLRKKSNGSCCLSPRGRRSCCYYTMSLSTFVRSSDYLAKVAHKEDEEVVFICMLDCVSIGRDSRSFWSSSSLVNSSKKRRVVGTIWREVSCVSEKWRSKKKRRKEGKSPQALLNHVEVHTTTFKCSSCWTPSAKRKEDLDSLCRRRRLNVSSEFRNDETLFRFLECHCCC